MTTYEFTQINKRNTNNHENDSTELDQDEKDNNLILLAKLRKYEIHTNKFLLKSCSAYYSLDFYGWKKHNNPDFINILKNDFNSNSIDDLKRSCKTLIKIASPSIKRIIDVENIDTICVVPRAKIKNNYKNNQLLFSRCIELIINKINQEEYNIEDGSDYILRHTNTRTTHFHNKPEYGGDGDEPYQGITKETCDISSSVKGKTILLIDDVYTKTINIDEDCIQALIDNGAKKVVLYTIGKTYH